MRALSIRLALAILGTIPALAACTSVFPPRADLSRDSVLKSEIALRHGPGTRADVLRAELAAEGFVVGASEVPGFRYSATRAEQNLPCYTYARLDWTEDHRGRIALIQATRLQCR